MLAQVTDLQLKRPESFYWTPYCIDMLLMQAKTWVSWGRRVRGRKAMTMKAERRIGRRRSSSSQRTSTTWLAPSRRRLRAAPSTPFRSTSSAWDSGCRRRNTTLLTASKRRPLTADTYRSSPTEYSLPHLTDPVFSCVCVCVCPKNNF